MNKVLRESAAELLGRDETQQLLDKLASKSPKLVEDLAPVTSLGTVTKVLQNLLDESVVIRDMRTIVETLSDECGKTQDPEQLTNLVRPKLGRMIVQDLVDTEETLEVMTLDLSLNNCSTTYYNKTKEIKRSFLNQG